VKIAILPLLFPLNGPVSLKDGLEVVKELLHFKPFSTFCTSDFGFLKDFQKAAPAKIELDKSKRKYLE